MRITTDDGVGLEVEVTGAGPGLLLVHGFGGAKEDFADHVDELARDHKVVTFDHRGHGASDNPDARAAYSLDRLVADTLQVVDETGLDSFRLLGHSMGGMVARRVQIRAPERVEALIMMDTCAGPIPGFDPKLMDTAAEHALTGGKDALKDLLDMAPALETPAYKRVLNQRHGFAEFEARKWDGVSAVMWGTMASELAHQPDDLAAMADSVRCPFLILVGEEDTPFMTASRVMVEAIPAAQLVVIPDAGHSPQFENPRAWIDALSSFLAAVPAIAT